MRLGTFRQFTFCISLPLRPKSETKRLKFGISPQLIATTQTRWSLANIIADVAMFLCLFLN